MYIYIYLFIYIYKHLFYIGVSDHVCALHANHDRRLLHRVSAHAPSHALGQLVMAATFGLSKANAFPKSIG